MSADKDTLEPRAVLDALEQIELAVHNWRQGAVPPSADNRARFVDMLDGARNLCEMFPSCKPLAPEALTADVERRLRELGDWLEAIVQVGLASRRVAHPRLGDAVDRAVATDAAARVETAQSALAKLTDKMQELADAHAPRATPKVTP